MSTKIYDAYRSPLKKLKPALEFLRSQMEPEVVHAYAKIAGKTTEAERAAIFKEWGVDKPTPRQYVGSLHTLTQAKVEAALKNPNASYHETLSSVVFVYLGEDFALYRCWGVGTDKLWGGNPKKRPKYWPHWLKDYHYQSSTDPAPWMTWDESEARGEVWKDLCIRQTGEPHLIYRIFSTDAHTSLRFWNIEHLYNKTYWPKVDMES